MMCITLKKNKNKVVNKITMQIPPKPTEAHFLTSLSSKLNNLK